MKFLSLFSGIGGFDYGFIKAGHECVGWCELDKFAHKAFQIIHDPNGVIPNEFDTRNIADGFIRTIEQRSGTIDAIVAGFPCQAFSIAGKRDGFKDQTRGTLFFEIIRIAEIAKPQYLILENVKGLLNHDGGRTFEIILATLDDLGYDVEWQLLNSKDFGVPQNRERVFIVASVRGTSRFKLFPIIRKSEGIIKVVGLLDIKGKDQIRRVYSIDYLSPCLSTMQGGNQQPKILFQDKIRKLTPIECFRLQSYPDEWYYKLKVNGFSDTQLYKLAGNGVTSNVSYEIAKGLIK